MKDSGVRPPLPSTLRQVEIFETLGDEEREAISSRIEIRRYRAGKHVFVEGDPSDGLYVVHSGEVGIVTEAGGQGRILARLGQGQCFGEMSLLTGEPRSTSVIATLDAELLFLGDAAFEDLLRRYPSVALAIGRTLSLRLRRANRASREDARERIIFCCPVTTLLDPTEFSTGLARSLAACRGADILLLCLGRPPDAPEAAMGLDDLLKAVRSGQTPAFTDYTAELEAGVRILSPRATRGDWNPRLLGRLLGLAVGQCGGIVVSADAPDAGNEDEASGNLPYLGQAIRQSDVALLVVDTTAPSLERARALDVQPSGASGTESKPWKVALVRPREVTPGTIRRVEDRLDLPVTYQIVRDDPASLRRLARRLSHAAVGLALGGGGARGFAHIGILDVLDGEGIPIDVIGGTSMGSIISSLYAAGMEVTELTRTVRREWVDRNPLNDYTLPKSALIRGKRAERVLRRVFGETLIEDLPAPFFAVSADLVSAEEVVLSRGLLWRAVRASGSIPVLLTPVKVDGRFLVDGAIINNVPGDLLGRFGADISIASDVTLRKESYFEGLFQKEKGVGFLGKLLRRSGLFREWLDYPGIMRTLRRIIDIEGLEIMKTKSATFDVCIRPAVAGYDILDFSKLDQLIDEGREAATRALPTIRSRMREAAERSVGPGVGAG
jgi:predicted acylesterase/phospholipase RssA/CRP-like cAMP-binding protein